MERRKTVHYTPFQAMCLSWVLCFLEDCQVVKNCFGAILVVAADEQAYESGLIR